MSVQHTPHMHHPENVVWVSLPHRLFDIERKSMLPVHRGLLRGDCRVSFVYQLPSNRSRRRMDDAIFCICVFPGGREEHFSNDEDLICWEMGCRWVLQTHHQYHLHSMCNQNMIVLFIPLNIMIKAFPTCHHGPRSTDLSSYNEHNPYCRYYWTILNGKE